MLHDCSTVLQPPQVSSARANQQQQQHLEFRSNYERQGGRGTRPFRDLHSQQLYIIIVILRRFDPNEHIHPWMSTVVHRIHSFIHKSISETRYITDHSVRHSSDMLDRHSPNSSTATADDDDNDSPYSIQSTTQHNNGVCPQ